MPSPLGHALTGFAVGWLATPQVPGQDPASGAFPGLRSTQPGSVSQFLRRWQWPMALAAAGMAPDLDLLAGMHSRQTHSIGASLLVFAGGWLWLRSRHHHPARAALALSLAYASHPLLDWLAHDTTPPLGIMALWPFSGAFYVSPLSVFMGISRKYWLAVAWKQNAVSVARELAVLVPMAALALWWQGLPSGSGTGAQKLQRFGPPSRRRRKSTNQ